MKIFLALIFILLSTPAFAQSSGHFAITRSVVAGGGALSTNSTFSLGSTVGEPIPSSTNTNGEFTIRSGFWIRPAPVVFSPRISGNDFLFSFETERGGIYTAQFADSLSSSSWQNLPAISGDGTIKAATNSASNSTQRFYRLIEQ